MKIAMFGVTGTIGSALLQQTLAAGHEVHALVRAPEKLGPMASRILITTGDAGDEKAVSTTISGADAVLSALGGVRGPESLSRGTEAIIAAMTEHGVRRLVAAQGFHLRFPGDPGNLGQKVMQPILRFAISRGISEHAPAMPALLQRSGLDWTVVRFPRVLTGRPPGAHRTGILRLAPWSTVHDIDVATFMLACVSDAATIRQAPMIARS